MALSVTTAAAITTMAAAAATIDTSVSPPLHLLDYIGSGCSPIYHGAQSLEISRMYMVTPWENDYMYSVENLVGGMNWLFGQATAPMRERRLQKMLNRCLASLENLTTLECVALLYYPLHHLQTPLSPKSPSPKSSYVHGSSCC